MRWHRCLRCDSWVPLPARHPDPRGAARPRRGRGPAARARAARQDRPAHDRRRPRSALPRLGILAAAIFVFAANRGSCGSRCSRCSPTSSSGSPRRGRGRRHRGPPELFSVQSGTLMKIGLVVAAYALLEGVEAVGLWWQRRWAEYLTFVATTVLLPVEIHELTDGSRPSRSSLSRQPRDRRLSRLRQAALRPARRGRGRARVRERDTGWDALERTAPGALPPKPRAPSRPPRPHTPRPCRHGPSRAPRASYGRSRRPARRSGRAAEAERAPGGRPRRARSARDRRPRP